MVIHDCGEHSSQLVECSSCDDVESIGLSLPCSGAKLQIHCISASLCHKLVGAIEAPSFGVVCTSERHRDTTGHTVAWVYLRAMGSIPQIAQNKLLMLPAELNVIVHTELQTFSRFVSDG